MITGGAVHEVVLPRCHSNVTARSGPRPYPAHPPKPMVTTRSQRRREKSPAPARATKKRADDDNGAVVAAARQDDGARGGSTPDGARILWDQVIILAALHCFAAYGVQQWWAGRYSLSLVATQCALLVFSGLSATAGGHRLFTHVAYEAAAAVHGVFMVGLLLGFTGSAFSWIYTHRTHHQYTDTDLDPHDARKGLWWSHFGWFVVPSVPAIERARALQNTRTLRFWRVHWVLDRFHTILAVTTNAVSPWMLCPDQGGWDLFLTTCVRVAITVNMAASASKPPRSAPYQRHSVASASPAPRAGVNTHNTAISGRTGGPWPPSCCDRAYGPT